MRSGRQDLAAYPQVNIPERLQSYAVDGATRYDVHLVRATLDSLVGMRPTPTAQPPQGMCLDQGYDEQGGHAILAACGCTAPMRSRGAEARAIKDKASHKARRGGVERTQA